MKEYKKPYFEEEIIEIEDIILASPGDEGNAENGGQAGDVKDIFPTL